MIVRVVLYWLVALLLGAHFLRAGNLTVAIMCVAVPFLFLYRRRLSRVLLQALAYGAAAAWLYTAWRLVQARQALGEHWMLAAAILGTVAAVSLLAGLLLNSRMMREWFAK